MGEAVSLMFPDVSFKSFVHPGCSLTILFALSSAWAANALHSGNSFQGIFVSLIKPLVRSQRCKTSFIGKASVTCLAERNAWWASVMALFNVPDLISNKADEPIDTKSYKKIDIEKPIHTSTKRQNNSGVFRLWTGCDDAGFDDAGFAADAG